MLDATKHQDDKIGRVVAALAFLTSAAVALFFASKMTAARYTFEYEDAPNFGHGTYPLAAWAAFGFFVCVLASVVLLLLSLAVPLKLPEPDRDSPGSLYGSHLFFTYIADEDRAHWVARWASESDAGRTGEKIARDFGRETHNLAERAKIKYRHTSEAVAFFILALLFLTMSVVLAIGRPTGGSDPIPWDWKLRFALAALICVQGFLQLYAAQADASVSVETRRLAQSADAKLQRKARRKLALSRTYIHLSWFLPIYVCALLVPGEDPKSRQWGAVVLLAGLIVCFFACAHRWDPADVAARGELLTPVAIAEAREKIRKDRFQAAAWMIWAVAVAVLGIAALSLGGVTRLGAALVPALMVMGQSITWQIRRHRAMMRSVDKAGGLDVRLRKRIGRAVAEPLAGVQVLWSLLRWKAKR